MAIYTVDATATTTTNVSQIWTTLTTYQTTLQFTLPNTNDKSTDRKLILDSGLYLINNTFAEALTSTLTVQQLGRLVCVAQSLKPSSIGRQDGDQDDFQTLATICYAADNGLTELHGPQALMIVSAAIDFIEHTNDKCSNIRKNLKIWLLPFFQAVHRFR